MESCDELGLTASTFPESMLIVAEDTIGLKMSYDAAVNVVYQDLACYRYQRDWSIVTGLMFISFLEDGGDVHCWLSSNPPVLCQISMTFGIVLLAQVQVFRCCFQDKCSDCIRAGCFIWVLVLQKPYDTWYLDSDVFPGRMRAWAFVREVACILSSVS